MTYFEMHCHTQYSMFDGFDKIKNKVAYAKEMGQKALGISDHGNACGIIQLYLECKKQGLKPLMGVEAYFQPVFNPDKPRYHLGLYAYNAKGYENLCRIISEANEKNFHYKMHVTWDLLEKYNEGLICTSACIAGFISQAITKGKKDLAVKAALRFKEIFEDNFYLEIQPIKIDNDGTQEHANKILMAIGKKYGIKSILTTDAHFTHEKDFDSYLMMHRLSKIGSKKGEGFTLEQIEKTYKERYMHTEEEITSKFVKMHGHYPSEQLQAMDEIYSKIDIELEFSGSIPTYDDVDDTYQELKRICIQELKDTNRYNKKYLERLKYEISVINKHGLCDYFLIVYEYVKYAKENNIYVGPGRGSCGGSLTTDLLGITEIDPLVVGTDFDRFLRPDKKKMPDIDLDFESSSDDTSGQGMVIKHILDKYHGRSSKITTFGYYKSANLINDLCKVYEITGPEVQRIKSILQSKVPEMAHFEFEDIDYNEIIQDINVRNIDHEYKNFVKHFCMLCGQAKYYGQHPAGVLVTSGDIAKWVPMMKVKGQMICSFDKYDVEAVDMVKFDILALKTLNVIKEIEEVTNDKFDRRKVVEANDGGGTKVSHEMYKNFSEGNTLGIFQLNKDVAQNILKDIKADNIQDVIAAISLNRPGTLKLKTHEQYAANKEELDDTTVWYPYTKDAYGSIIYQEHVMRIARGLAHMQSDSVDKLMKFKFNEEQRVHLKEEFMDGAKEHSNIPKSVSGPLFDAMALYMFNKGHGAGYALISEWMMYHKVKHPTEFWFATLKWEYDDAKKSQYLVEAMQDGIVTFLPHVNYTSEYSIRKVDDENVIQMGYNVIKNVGPTAANLIQAERRKNGPFHSYDDFTNRCKGRSVTSRVVESLVEDGALEFDKQTYVKRVKQFNSTLYMKGLRKNK